MAVSLAFKVHFRSGMNAEVHLVSPNKETNYTIEKIGGLFLAYVCTTIVLDVIFSDTDGFGWNGVGESSFVTGNIRRLLVETGIRLEDGTEFLFGGYILAFCVVVMVGILTEAKVWAPRGFEVYLNRREIERMARRSWRRLQQYYRDQWRE